MKRLYTFALAVSLLFSACGGSGDDAGNGEMAASETTTTAEAVDDQAPVAESAAESDESTTTTVAVQALGDGNEDTTFYGNPPGTGTVEIGEITYEFDLNILCLSMFGAMGIAGQALDGSAVTVDADFPPEGWETSAEDWEPPSISIDDEDRDIRWQSGGVATDMYPEGSSQIDSFTADGRLAVGEATFVNSYTFGEDLIVETGQFEFHCPEE